MDTIGLLREFLSTEASVNADILTSGANEDLIGLGVIDSMTLLNLVSFMEKQFDIRVLDEDISTRNFRSLTAMEAFLEFKRAERSRC
jgi:methoxymalonate biosynthesis acyl carrier protein